GDASSCRRCRGRYRSHCPSRGRRDDYEPHGSRRIHRLPGPRARSERCPGLHRPRLHRRGRSRADAVGHRLDGGGARGGCAWRPSLHHQHHRTGRAVRGPPPIGWEGFGVRPDLSVPCHRPVLWMMNDTSSAESRLSRLLERLLSGAEEAFRLGDFEQARATAEEVRTVDPDNQRAERLLSQVALRQRGGGGERALMTLLFADLVGSTMPSEQVQPEQLRDLFAFYRSIAHEAVERYSGSVMHYSGDGILAGFGHPTPHEDDARRAVLAGLDLVAGMKDARGDLERRIGVAPAVRVGSHTGRVVVTDLSAGRSVRERDSIVGVAPNLAARVQQEAEPDSVVISDVTRQLVDVDFFLRSL